MAGTVVDERPALEPPSQIEEGDLLADCSTTVQGELALGRNLLVAFMPWFGWNFEDGIVISERLRKEGILTSRHIYEHKYVITERDYGDHREKLRAILKNRLREKRDYRRILEERGKDRAEQWLNKQIASYRIDYKLKVKEGDVISSSIPFIEVTYTKEGAKRSTLSIPLKESKPPIGVRGRVIDIEVYFEREALPDRVYRIFRFLIEEEKPIQVGDKLSGRHGNKGVVTKILDEEQMPFFVDRESPHRHGLLFSDGKSYEDVGHVHVDVVLNPLGIIARQNLGQLYEAHLGWIAAKKGRKDFKAPLVSDLHPDEMMKLLDESELEGGKKLLCYRDPKTGKAVKVKNPVTVGYIYMMKLNHISSEKINVRSSGTYTRTTNQPLKGRRLQGGQRLGEMEVWALLAHGAKEIIREMLSIRSDEVVGRSKLREFRKPLDKSITGHPPESLRLFIFFLRSLGLSPILLNKDGEDITDDLLKRVGLPKEEAKDLKVEAIDLSIATEDEIRNSCKKIENYQQIEDDKYYRFDAETLAEYLDRIRLPSLHESELPDFKAAFGKYRNNTQDLEHFKTSLKRDVLNIRRLKNYEDVIAYFGGLDLDKFREFIRKDIEALKAEVANKPQAARWRGDLSNCEYLLEMLDFCERGFNCWMGYIDISDMPVMNPLFYPFFSELLSYIGDRLEEGDVEKFFKSPVGTLSQGLLKRLRRDPKEAFPFFQNMDLKKLYEELERDVKSKPGFSKYSHLLNMVSSLLGRGQDLDVLFIRVLPVIPPMYRPKHKIKGGKITHAYLSTRYASILYWYTRDWRKLAWAVADLYSLRLKRRTGPEERPFEEFLKGKKGLFRKAILGKRVDYSGRAVIVVDPSLKIDECRIPYHMAVQIYEPVLIRNFLGGIFRRLFVGLIRRNYSDTQIKDLFRNTLSSLSEDYPLLLNRNPTLHRMGIMAFRPQISEDDSDTNITVNPLITQPFGADFDGDQMAAFLPLLDSSREEARRLYPSENLLSPANGHLVANISQDIVLGTYLLSFETEGRRQLNQVLGGEVTPGLGKKELIRILEEKGNPEMVQCLEMIKDLGFHAATSFGTSISVFDLKDPEFAKVNWDEDWESIKGQLSEENPFSWMVKSGARGTKRQVQMLVGVLGEVEGPRGISKLIEVNYRDGLSIGEYFFSCYESRRSQIDKQLATPKAGWLMRKLILATQDIVVDEEDCGTSNYLTFDFASASDEDRRRLLGRFYRKDGEDILITEEELTALSKMDSPPKVQVRSPIFCLSEGVCRKCYGWDLSKKELVELGTPVGIIASQSIGERCTQLSISAFHRAGEEINLDKVRNFFEGRDRKRRKKLEEIEIDSDPGALASIALELLKEIRSCFREVDVKHFEVVLKRMLSFGKVEDPGTTDLSPGAVLPLKDLRNRKSCGIKAVHTLVGLGRIICSFTSWLLRLAFDRSFEALREAVISGGRSKLEGPLEHIMVSHYNL